MGRFASPKPLGKAGVAGFAIASILALTAFASSASAAEIFSNPEDIFVSQQLGCQLYSNESNRFDIGEEVDNYCGTFVALDDVIYGDDTAKEDVDSLYAIDSPNQTTGGSGTSADPFKLTTVVHVAPISQTAVIAQVESSILTITETETYVEGQDFFRTDITVHNDTNVTQSPVLYHAGDCFMDSDIGYAVDDTATSGAVFCTPQQPNLELDRASTVPPQGENQGILGFVPIGGGSNYLEEFAEEMDGGDNSLFDAIDGLPFDDTCRDCTRNPEIDPAVDNGVGLSWALSLPGGGEATRCFLTVDSRSNNVPDVPTGCTPAANPPATIAQKPPSCKLRISRARIFLFSRHPRMRLVARYRSKEPADVNIDYVAVQNGHKLPLGEVVKHFGKHGLFRLRKELTESEAESLRSTDRFIVHFKIPGEPGFCARQYTKHLTVPRIVEGQRVVFQEDSKFPQPGSGHPEN